MFYRVLIANRGEAACRIIKTCRRLGVASIAIFTAEDQKALHVRLADEAYEVPSYLDAETIVAIAKKADVDGLHPGYGFLAENADFSARCWHQGIVFIGPLPQAIAAMGDKDQARKRAMQLGIPVLPSITENGETAKTLLNQAKILGFPLLIKPLAGGGGKGMKVLLSEESFFESLASAKREAKNAFGDDRVLLEKYLYPVRHIEVQIFGDAYGNIVHLGERDCSLQRRHQKIIEESPSPFIDDTVREQLFDAAIRLGKSIGYVSAGTIEFLVDENKHFYFIEMNTRLQVEHPVTEMRYGIDLVELQMAIATGATLPPQEQFAPKGWAIEARILAEDPAQGFLPQAGTIAKQWQPPAEVARFDCGFDTGDVVSPAYDSMLAKCIAFGDNRQMAVRKLAQALMQTAFLGLKTNLAFLQDLLDRCEFKSSLYHTRWLEEKYKEPAKETWPLFAATLKYMLEKEKNAVPPWWHDGWTPLGQRKQTLYWRADSQAIKVDLRMENHDYILTSHDDCWQGRGWLLDETAMLFTTPRKQQKLATFLAPPYCEIATLAKRYTFVLIEQHQGEKLNTEEIGGLAAPMPAKVVAIHVKPNDPVEKGKPLATLEAMKMEHVISAPYDGIVTAVLCKIGDVTAAKAPLFQVDPKEKAP